MIPGRAKPPRRYYRPLILRYVPTHVFKHDAVFPKIRKFITVSFNNILQQSCNSLLKRFLVGSSEHYVCYIFNLFFSEGYVSNYDILKVYYGRLQGRAVPLGQTRQGRSFRETNMFLEVSLHSSVAGNQNSLLLEWMIQYIINENIYCSAVK